MAAGPLFVGVDVGTQGTKALVYEQRTGKVISRGAKPYDVLKTNVPGRAEQHPSLWIEVRNLQAFIVWTENSSCPLRKFIVYFTGMKLVLNRKQK